MSVSCSSSWAVVRLAASTSPISGSEMCPARSTSIVAGQILRLEDLDRQLVHRRDLVVGSKRRELRLVGRGKRPTIGDRTAARVGAARQRSRTESPANARTFYETIHETLGQPSQMPMHRAISLERGRTICKLQSTPNAANGRNSTAGRCRRYQRSGAVDGQRGENAAGISAGVDADAVGALLDPVGDGMAVDDDEAMIAVILSRNGSRIQRRSDCSCWSSATPGRIPAWTIR